MSAYICNHCDEEMDTEVEWEKHKTYCVKLQRAMDMQSRIATLEAQLAEYEGIDEYVKAQAKAFGECLEERDTLRTALRQVAKTGGEMKFSEEDDKHRADRLSVNCHWLIAQFDAIHAIVCPDHIGSWQDRVKKVVETIKAQWGGES